MTEEYLGLTAFTVLLFLMAVWAILGKIMSGYTNIGFLITSILTTVVLFTFIVVFTIIFNL